MPCVTFSIITKVLDNFYNDVRPKVVIFPNSALVTNFYSELQKFQNIPDCKHAQFAERYLDFMEDDDDNRQQLYPEVIGFLAYVVVLIFKYHYQCEFGTAWC